jgi:type VI secretion system protein ImpB
MASGKDGSVAPKERINIKYVPATGDQQEEVELPLRMMVLGDFLGKSDDTPLEDRDTLSVDKNTFSSVIKEAGLEKQLTVKNALSDDPDATLAVDLKFESIRDFEPDAIAQQVPELKKLIELRESLVALKGPLGNMPAFRKRLEQLLADESSREKLLSELEAVATETKSNKPTNETDVEVSDDQSDKK